MPPLRKLAALIYFYYGLRFATCNFYSAVKQTKRTMGPYKLFFVFVPEKKNLSCKQSRSLQPLFASHSVQLYTGFWSLKSHCYTTRSVFWILYLAVKNKNVLPIYVTSKNSLPPVLVSFSLGQIHSVTLN